MRAVDLIAEKRDGGCLSPEEIRFLVEGYTRGEVPDYQMAAFCMAVYLKGMAEAETVALTQAMAGSGETVDFPGVEGFIADKHSTGGVGDKVSLVLLPLIAAAGLKVGKLSGRGLGHTGGTIDKLESVPGFRAALEVEQMVAQVNRVGIALGEATPNLAPADRKLYALRDVTATVGALPLIASSIMSKKLCVRSDGIVLDVKTGSGALMRSLEEAEALARLMIRIGEASGRKMAALITNMDQPLGCAVGNALEVKEAIQTLRGEGPPDVVELCTRLGAELLIMAGETDTVQAGQAKLAALLRDGRAFERFCAWIAAQGGDPAAVEDPQRLPQAEHPRVIEAPLSGFLERLDALAVGRAAHLLGAGRSRKGEAIDPAAGVVVHAKVGDRVERGQPLLTLHADEAERLPLAQAALEGAWRIQDRAPALSPLVLKAL